MGIKFWAFTTGFLVWGGLQIAEAGLRVTAGY